MTRKDDEALTTLEEAMDWLLRLQGEPAGGEAWRDFDAWIRRSPAHRDAWARALKTWNVIGEVPPAHAHLWSPQAPPPVTPAAAPQHRRRPWRLGVGVALAACLAVAIFAPSVMLWLEADYMTQTAENRRITLDDGTTIDLGADSAISADIDDRGRRVTLLSGEAFFEVAHDAGRPFVVDAGGVRIQVIGTAFDVQLSSMETRVELARGIVGISAAGGGTRELAPGDMIVVDRQSGAMLQTRIAEEDIAVWRHGRLFVNDVTIAAVVEQLQRYHPAWITIPDQTLSARRVTGLYDLRDPDRALRALVEPYGGKVRAVSAYLRILSPF